MGNDHVDRRVDRMGIASWPSIVAITIVVAALCVLAVRPFIVLREIRDVHDRNVATIDSAQQLVRGLQLLSAEEVGEHEAYRLQHSQQSALRYRQLRAAEERTLAQMELLADVAGPRSAAQVDTLRALGGRGHELTDGYLSGDIDEARFQQQVPALRLIRDSTAAVLASLDTSLTKARDADVAHGATLLAKQRILTLAIGTLALLGVGIVVVLARRDRALSKRLSEALEEEARAREDAERRRREVEELTDSKTRLMRGFSHDVKNPIGAADGFMQLLEDGIPGPDRLTKAQALNVGRARRSLAEALRLIDDLLQLARADAGQLDVRKEPVDLTALAQETVEDYRAQAERKGLTLGVEANGNPVYARSDPARLRQVLGNLVSNAVKYTARGRVDVKITAQRRDADGSTPRASIEVADTGDGIPPDQQRLVFQEFVRLDPNGAPGAGVGLAISQRIAHALDGEIKVTSEAGRGSSFVLWLPAAEGTRET